MPGASGPKSQPRIKLNGREEATVMRLSLVRGPADLEDILYFQTAAEGPAR